MQMSTNMHWDTRDKEYSKLTVEPCGGISYTKGKTLTIKFDSPSGYLTIFLGWRDLVTLSDKIGDMLEVVKRVEDTESDDPSDPR